MAEWADVWVDNFGERTALERKALFFLPKAGPALNALGVRQNILEAFSKTSMPKEDRAGLAVIRTVLNCAPVTYGGAGRFLKTANGYLASRHEKLRFTNRDLIACVFRLKDIPDVMRELNVDEARVAALSGLKRDVVLSAVERYRITLVDALAIWKALLSLKAREKAEGKFLGVLDGNPERFIRTDRRHRVAVKKAGGSDEDPSFVYGRDDLKPAPAKGHPWTVG